MRASLRLQVWERTCGRAHVCGVRGVRARLCVRARSHPPSLRAQTQGRAADRGVAGGQAGWGAAACRGQPSPAAGPLLRSVA